MSRQYMVSGLWILSLMDVTFLVFSTNQEKSGQCLLALSTACGSFGKVFKPRIQKSSKQWFYLTIQCEVHMYMYEHYSIICKLHGSPVEGSTSPTVVQACF